MAEHYADRLAMLDVWLALGGHVSAFEAWMAEPKRTAADAWAELMAAVRGDIAVLLEGTNPPAGDELLALVQAR